MQTVFFKKNLILISLIAFIILVISFIFYQKQSIKRPPGKNFLAEQFDSLSDAEKYKYQEQLARVIARKDLAGCDAVRDQNSRTVCINNTAIILAIEKQDISYCQKIGAQSSSRENCERQAIFQKSVRSKNQKVCNEVQSQESREQCSDNFYLQTALKKQDPAACDLAPSDDRRKLCRDNYLLSVKDFVQNLEKFDCGALMSTGAIADCLMLKELPTENIKEADFCQSKMKSSVMAVYCNILADL